MPMNGIRYAGTRRPRDSGNLGQVQNPRHSPLFPSKWEEDMVGSVMISAISSSLLIKNKLSILVLFTALPQFSGNVKTERDAGSICLKIPNASESIIRATILWMCFSTFDAHLQRASQAVWGSTCSINIFTFRGNGPEKTWLQLN